MTIQVQAVETAIKKNDAGWQAQKNFLTTLSREERARYLGYVPGPGEPSLEQAEQAAKASLAAAKAPAAGAPAAFDLRNVGGKNFITPVKNQGSCGSCVAFGSVATVEGTTRFKRNQPDLAIDLSEAHLFYCHGRNEGRRCNNGWWVPPALDAIKSIGVSDEACYPYTAWRPSLFESLQRLAESGGKDHCLERNQYAGRHEGMALQQWPARGLLQRL